MIAEEEINEEVDEELIAEISKPTPREQMYLSIDAMLNEVKGTSITSTSQIVDFLLDIRNLAVECEEIFLQTSKAMCFAIKKNLFYQDTFGKVEMPADWTPAPYGDEDL